MGDSLADHRGQVRVRLFASLDSLIAARGYDSITLADIAAGAGVGRTAVYNHFPDKESVLVTMAQERTETYLHRLNAALTEATSPLDKLAVFVRMQMTELAGHHARMGGVGTALSIAGRTAIREHVTPIMTVLEDILRSAERAGDIGSHDTAMAARMISTVTAGRFTVGLDADERERVLARVTDFVLHGIGARDS